MASDEEEFERRAWEVGRTGPVRREREAAIVSADGGPGRSALAVTVYRLEVIAGT
jgi:hypothetical protein